jgi:hypothetical protein
MTNSTRPGHAFRHLLDVVRAPERLATLDDADWETVLRLADASRLTGRLVFDVDRLGLAGRGPQWLVDRLDASRAFCRETERAVAWEVNRIARAFFDQPFRWVLLKGAGYVAAGLPPARGRRVADIDVLVPFEALDAAETALRGQGWETVELNDYDERYYREWMHELPPMVHVTRRSVVDLHHTILPRTSRLRPDPKRLIDRAVAAGPALVLCPTHMVIHAAVHLFHDGEISGAARDLVDLDGLLREFSATRDFWSDLVTESEALDAARPVFYALRYAERLLGTPVPDTLADARARWAPPAPVRRLMDVLITETLHGETHAFAGASALALYTRSHWLRMPPLMLARHLARKATAR